MKTKLIYTIFGALLLGLIFQSNSGGRAAGANQGNTGAPGDNSQTCKSCHNSSAIQVNLSIDLFDQNGLSVVADGYIPGETYEVQVTVNATVGNPAGYGFQLMALNGAFGENAAQATDWSNPAINVKISTINSTGRKYAEHKGVTGNNVFSLDWTAPSNGGPVTFYACGNGVNGNGQNSGDGSGCSSLTVEELETSSSEPITIIQEFSVFPNPFRDAVQLNIESSQAKNMRLVITDLTGRQVLFQEIKVQAGQNLFNIDASSWMSGTYQLKLVSSHVFIEKLLIRQ